MKINTSLFSRIFFLFFLIITINQGINAQSQNSAYWKINLNGGTSLFFGDIKQYRIWPITNYENEWRLGGGVAITRQFSPIFGLRGQAVFGQLSGTHRSWNRFFDDNYIEFNLNTVVNMSNLIGRTHNNRFANIYLTAGIGLLNYNTTLYRLSDKKIVGNEGNGNGKGIGGRTLEGIFSGGIGVDFKINDKFSVNIETTNRIMNSDKLDTWVNGFPYDVYNYTSLGISFKLGTSNKSIGVSQSAYERTNPRKQYNVESPKTIYKKKVIPTPIETEIVPVSPPVVSTKKIVTTVKKAQPEPRAIKVYPEPKKVKALEYRVQIRAKYNRPLKRSYLSAKYNIPASDIKEDKHNGYYIYTVGSFDTYEQARQKRNRLRSYNGATDAFVVAFRNGKRLIKLP